MSSQVNNPGSGSSSTTYYEQEIDSLENEIGRLKKDSAIFLKSSQNNFKEKLHSDIEIIKLENQVKKYKKERNTFCLYGLSIGIAVGFAIATIFKK